MNDIRALAPKMPTKYLRDFFEEKDIPEVNWVIFDSEGIEHHISNVVVVEHITTVGAAEAKQLAQVFRRLDFANADINHFLRHLADAVVNRAGREDNPTGEGSLRGKTPDQLAAQANRVFLDMMQSDRPITVAEVKRLAKKRPALWGKYVKYVESFWAGREGNPAVTGVDGKRRSFKAPRRNNPASLRKYKSEGHMKENPTRKYKSEEGAQEYAEEMGLAYGFSTFSDGWFVGSPRELEDIGVFSYHLPSPESRTRPRRSNPGSAADLVRKLKF